MDQTKMVKQMVDFQKTTFDNAYNAMVMAQEQTNSMMSMSLEQATWIPGEGKAAVKEWLNACQKGSQDFKQAVDDSFKGVESFFSDTKKTSAKTAKKTSTK